MEDVNAIPVWKKSKLAAATVMMLKGYAPPLTACTSCERSLERADGVVNVHFKDKSVFYDCPHCGGTNERPLQRPQEDPYG
jgi:predicted RNA-binding Zn-ribbon protein involved in translation (DUF1610 family)